MSVQPSIHPPTPEDVRALVARELAIIRDPERRHALAALLIDPVVRVRDRDYGAPDERYACWVVAESADAGIELVYCAEGFGPQFPWGFVDTGSRSMGMDAQWNWYLEEAFVRSGLCKGRVGGMDEEAFHLSPEERFPCEPWPNPTIT